MNQSSFDFKQISYLKSVQKTDKEDPPNDKSLLRSYELYKLLIYIGSIFNT